MASYNGKPAATLNAAMKLYLPETAGCTYADYPMQHGQWLKPNDKTPPHDGQHQQQPCFIKTGNQQPAADGIKTGYVWGPGPAGFGYYHLLTKPAHTILYNRIVNGRVFVGSDAEPGCCGCLGAKDPRTQLPKHAVKADDVDDLRRLEYARSVATVPNDTVAAQDALAQAQVTAQSAYQFDQNYQLGMHVVGQGMVR